MPYGPHTTVDRERMLRTIGVPDIQHLFADIPPELRASPLRLPGPIPELELAARLQTLAARNRTDLASFLGAGAYRHSTASDLKTSPFHSWRRECRLESSAK